ncbi:MAG: hypothetical protein ACPGWR_10250 [Ardenticatenaceae bacterium]
MTTNFYPSLEEFLAAPVEEVAKIAPATMIYSPSGTRRAAVLTGVSGQGHDYASWSRKRMLECIDLIFRHGVRHIFMPPVAPSLFNEITSEYREHLWNWLDWGLAGAEALADYQRFGWRVRIPFGKNLPRLRAATARLEAATPPKSAHTLWLYIVPDYNLPWQWILEAIHDSRVQTLDDAIRASYGEEIPPPTLCLASGKPTFSSSMMPPLITRSRIDCYWSQRPGYSLDERELRTILYDYAYLRKTWRADKSGRAEKALMYRTAWEQGPTIGLGMRLGPFWYPAPISPPPENNA